VIKVQDQKHGFSESRIKNNQPWDFIPVPFIAAAFLYCTLLFGLSSVSTFPVPPPFSFFDKLVHFFLFAGLSAVVAMGLHRAKHEYSSTMHLLIPVSFSVLYGLSDEIHQLTVPVRDFSTGDIAADALGAAAGAGVLLLMNQWRKFRR
jgi:VanZ family protein